MEITWLKLFKWLEETHPGPGIVRAQKMFHVNESDTDTLLLLKKKALELAILIVQECESGNERDSLLDDLLDLVFKANDIRKEM